MHKTKDVRVIHFPALLFAMKWDGKSPLLIGRLGLMERNNFAFPHQKHTR
jgi:hypothetical protein